MFKKKCIKYFLVTNFLLFLFILFSTKVEAASEYTIESYDIDIVVNENNTFDITENIKTEFYERKHGIYRKIPLNNTIIRNDGTESKNRAKISNIYVSEDYTVSKKMVIML